MAGPASAQEFPIFDQQFAVAALDQERLFTQSRFGQRTIAVFDQRAEALSQENLAIEQALESEELELTRQRSEMTAEEFAPLAEAFNEKANLLRAEQRQKTQDLVEFRAQSQERFFRQVGPVLLGLMRELRVGVIIEQDAIVLALPSIDLTDRAIARIDEVFAAE
ncbi:MAG: OmpH family outer membrane protein [Pseudomonadota bacterium]